MKGNKKSLVDAMEKGVNLREHILTLYNNYYYGGLMKLVVIGGGKFYSESLDVISIIFNCLGIVQWEDPDLF